MKIGEAIDSLCQTIQTSLCHNGRIRERARGPRAGSAVGSHGGGEGQAIPTNYRVFGNTGSHSGGLFLGPIGF